MQLDKPKPISTRDRTGGVDVCQEKVNVCVPAIKYNRTGSHILTGYGI